MANTTVTNQAITDASAHVLPWFVAWMIDHLLLPLLLIAEGYLMGSLFARGWVSEIEMPERWGAYHALGVVVFYAAGAATAGLGLRASVAFAASLQAKRWGVVCLNLLTVVGLSAAELWSSFSERRFHLALSPADRAVLTFLHQPADAAITPTLVDVSLVLPFASLTYGFSQQHKARKHLAAQGTAVQAGDDEVGEEAKPPVSVASRVRRLPAARGVSWWGKQRQTAGAAVKEVGRSLWTTASPYPRRRAARWASRGAPLQRSRTGAVAPGEDTAGLGVSEPAVKEAFHANGLLFHRFKKPARAKRVCSACHPPAPRSCHRTARIPLTGKGAVLPTPSGAGGDGPSWTRGVMDHVDDVHQRDARG